MNTIFGILKSGFIAGKPMQIWYGICLGLDGIIYSFINYLFKLFLVLAGANIFTEDTMVDFIRRIYQLIGVIMLFMLSYALLKKIVSPDSKDKESVGKIVLNVVKAIVLLAIVPSIFTYAFKVQDAVLKQNTIGKIIVGNKGVVIDGNNKTPKDMINEGGIVMAQGVFEAFLFPSDGDENTEIADGVTFAKLSEEVSKTGNFQSYKMAAEAVDNGRLTYFWGIALIAGAVIVYMLTSYCISLGFRIIKLAFYEVMAPVCIIASILPSQKEMLNRWIKTTLQVFLETFIRIAILYFVTYLLTVLKGAMSSGAILSNVNGTLKFFAWVAIVLGLVTFMKSAPDLISKLTGIESGNMSLGIRDQLAKGGLFTAGAVAGSLIGGGLRNAVGGVALAHERRKVAHDRMKREIEAAGGDRKGRRKARGKYAWAATKSVVGAMWGLTGSAAAGALSAGIHSDAGEVKDGKTMKEARDKGLKYAAEKHGARVAYNEANGGFFRAKKQRISDFFKSNLATYAGVRDPNVIREKIEQEDQLKKAGDDLQSAAESVVRSAINKNQAMSFGLDLVPGGLDGFYDDFRKKLSDAGRMALDALESSHVGDGSYGDQMAKYNIRRRDDGKIIFDTAADLKRFESFVSSMKLNATDENASGAGEAFDTIFKSYSKAVSNQGLLDKTFSSQLHTLLKAVQDQTFANVEAANKAMNDALKGISNASQRAAWQARWQDAIEAYTTGDDSSRSEQEKAAHNILLSLGDLEVAGTKLRGALARSLGDAAVVDAGWEYKHVTPDKAIRVTDDMFKNMMDNLDISRSELRTILAKLNEAEKNSGDDKK